MRDNYDYVEGNVVAPCWTCEKPTNHVEINFEAHLCSQECMQVRVNEFWAALEDPPPDRFAEAEFRHSDAGDSAPLTPWESGE